MPVRAQPLPAFGPLGGVRYRVAGVSFDMVKLPPGRFVDGEGAGRRELLVSRPFEIGTTLVTQALWRAVTGKSPSKFRGDDLPVEQVSWDDAQAFLGQLEALGFLGFRLPTEAEWAWSARCGVATRWAGADRAKSVAVVNQYETAPVGGLLPSAAGALDLSGNMMEWQQDWFGALSAGVDVQGPASGSDRVLRGGSWLSDPQLARVAIRYYYFSPGDRGSRLGVRLLRTAP